MATAIATSAAQSVEPRAVARGARVSVQTPFTLLVIDDTPGMWRLMHPLLARIGWRAVIARNCMEAVSALKRAIPDLMLLDLALPGLSGLALLKIARGHAHWKDVPVIAIHDASNPDAASRLAAAQRLGVSHWLTRSGDLAPPPPPTTTTTTTSRSTTPAPRRACMFADRDLLEAMRRVRPNAVPASISSV